MATVTAYVKTYKQSNDYISNYIQIVGSGDLPSNRVVLNAGDTLAINYQTATNGNCSITVSGFSSSHWTSTTNLSLTAVAQTVTKASKTGISVDLTLTLSFPFTYNDPEFGSGSDTATTQLYVRIGTPADVEPDPFVFASASNVSPGQYGYSDTVTLTGLNAAAAVAATNGAQFSINGGAYVTSGTISNNGSLRVRLIAATNGSASTTVSVGNGIATFTVYTADTTPNDFTIAPVLTGLSPYSDVYSDPITVGGLAVSVTASVSGSGAVLYKNSGQTAATSFTVSNGDRIRVKMTTNGTIGGSVSCTLTIGATSKTWTLTNSTASPASGIKVPIGVTALPINFSQVINFFGGKYQGVSWFPPMNINSYLRGGAYVPDITENSAIPTALPINLSNFVNSYTSFYKSGDPSGMHLFVDNQFDGGNDVEYPPLRIGDYLGYGNVKASCQYKYTLTTISGPTIARMDSVYGDPTVYHENNAVLTVILAIPNNSLSYQARYRVTCWAKLMYGSFPEISFSVDFTLEVSNGLV